MNQHPFQPNDESDHLNTTLDALVTGKRAPETGPASEDDSLTATARLINGQPAEAGEYPSDDTLDTIWRKVMQSQSHAVIAQEPLASFSPNGTAFEGRIANVPPRAESSRFSSWLSIAAMVALIVGLIGGAWTMRGGSDGSDEPSRLAAVMPLGTPGASPEDGVNWSSWIVPEECTLDRMLPSEVAKLQAETEGWPIPTYGPSSKPSPADAEAAAAGARALTSCFMFRSDGSYSSKPFLWRYTSPNSQLSHPEESLEHQESNGRDVSRELIGLTPSDLLVTTAVEPNEIQEELPLIYLPEQAIQFPDGRIGVPVAYLMPENTAQEELETLYTVLFVLSNESGGWLLDDSLSICVGDCDDYINGGPWEGNAYTMPETDLNVTPEASPSSDSDWLTYIQPEECTVEPLSEQAVATIVASPDAGEPREYTPLTTPDAATAEEAAAAARSAEACELGLAGDPAMPTSLMTDRFIAEYVSSGAGNIWEPRERNIRLGKQVSAAYPDGKPADLLRLSDEVPADTNVDDGQSAATSIAFLPSMAVQLPDGRVGFPGVSVLWTGNPNTPTQEQIETLPWLLSGFVVLSDASGTWQVDELLPICFGDCEEGWAMWSGEATPVATSEPDRSGLRPLPGTPVASPIAAPES